MDAGEDPCPAPNCHFDSGWASTPQCQSKIEQTDMGRKASTYTCKEYREEMVLLALQQRLQQKDLSEEERQRILEEIQRLETSMGMD
jgi:hypothetical protein